jgi:hypothetical protein
MLPRKKLEADLARAVRTLTQAGYTDNGGEYWKPPIGKPYDIQLADAFYKVATYLKNDTQRTAGMSEALCQYADAICEQGIKKRTTVGKSLSRTES